MKLYSKSMLAKYERDDVILSMLRKYAKPGDREFVSHQWLMKSPPKRLIYNSIYGSFLTSSRKRKRILDVGGGYCAITRRLLECHEYELLDIMAHDNPQSLKTLEQTIGRNFWINADWSTFTPAIEYDVVIANDLFCNVDQRLAMFIEKFLPVSAEIRLSITFYNTPRYYTVKRVDADEVFNIISWDGAQVKKALHKFKKHIREPRFDQFEQTQGSLFANKRDVCFVALHG